MSFKKSVVEVIMNDVYESFEKRGYVFVLDMDDIESFDSDFYDDELKALIMSGKLKNYGTRDEPLFDRDDFIQVYSEFFYDTTAANYDLMQAEAI